ncbi:beta-ketoacyl synthase N-terminal-like domain-containing protein [Paenibacillus taichungensis]|uniref:beta-ketoacyl synthase N-terminal-like domain-containing protein n=1 Tax=Paenibacillus taichungensis TaxID=484184 RepID=UPI0038D21431
MVLLDFENFKPEMASIKEVDNLDVAIIGMDAYYPNAPSYDDFWNLIANNKDCSGEFPLSRRKNAEKYLSYKNELQKNTKYFYGSYLENVDEFDYKFFNLTPKEANLMDPNQRLLLQSVWKSLEDSGYGGDKIYGTNTGVFITAESRKGLSYQQLIQEVALDELASSLPGNSVSMMPGRISFLLDLHGPAFVIDSACSSGLAAIHIATTMLRKGEIDLAIAGGVKLNFLPVDYDIRVGIESSDGRTQAFSDYSNGTTVGEGVASFILKPLSQALRDRDNIHAVIKGTSMKHDGRAIGVTAPNALAQEELLVSAWEDAGINPEDISYIEAHGTGTNLGDPIEVEGITRAFEQFTTKKQFCGLGSVKSNYAHTDNLAGMTGLLKCIMSLKNKKIPASLYFDKPNQKIEFESSPIFVNDELNEWKEDNERRICGVSSFGMSGTICHLVLEEAPSKNKDEEDKKDIDLLSRPYLFTLSAKSKYSLEKLISKYQTYLNLNDNVSIQDICYTASVGRGHYQYRLAILTSNIIELKEQISKTILKMTAEGLEDYENGIYCSKLAKDIRHPDTPVIDPCPYELADVAKTYVKGTNFDFTRLYQDLSPYRVNLPTYQFDEVGCWVDIPSSHISQTGTLIDQELLKVHGEILSFLESQKSSEEFERWKKVLKNSDVENTLESEKSKIYTLKGRENLKEYTPTELDIAEAWYLTIGVKDVDIDEDFFDIGGDSFIAVQLISKINNLYQVALNDIFVHRTIRRIAQHLNTKSNNNIYSKLDNLLQLTNQVQDLEKTHQEYLNDERTRYLNGLQVYDSKDLNETTSYRNILLTGSTGYLGIYLLADLIKFTDSKIHVLIRADDPEIAEQRLIMNWCHYFNQDDIISRLKDRVQIVVGDLSKDQFGMNDADYQNIAMRVDCVVHSAGLVKHFGEYSTFEEINVDGTTRLIEFSKIGNKKDFNLISSTAVGRGNIENKQYLLFSEFDSNVGQKINNPYGKSKFKAEQIVLQARNEGINTNIFRVGNIMFDSQTGQFQSNIETNGIYTILRAMIKMKIFPNTKREELDFSFIDYVSKSVVLLFNRPELVNEIHHIFNPHRSSMSEISEVVKQRIENIEVTEFPLFIDFIKTHYNDERYSSYINHMLLHFGVYDYLDSGGMTHYYIVSDKTELLLKKLGLIWEKPSENQINNMLDYCRRIEFI